MENHDLLRRIPRVDDVVRLSAEKNCDIPVSLLTEAVKAVISELRTRILNGDDGVSSPEELADLALQRAGGLTRYHLRGVINATGVVIHTNLGRAVLSEKAARHVYEVARGYSNLEYDLEKGIRGSRYSHTEALLCRITGAEAALVVNNNAAAVMLALASLAASREVIVSRGELVEIGGAFRVPEVMEQSGCRLHEVGTTNRTRISDYAAAVSDETGALLKVHTSNYRIVGFTESVGTSELKALGESRGVPVLFDLGSGALTDMNAFGIPGEPTAQSAIEDGADVVCISGDKLLGGPQAGIILGSRALLSRMRSHPLNRALRIDKLTLAALEATLMSYADEQAAVREIPVLSMLSLNKSVLQQKAAVLARLLRDSGVPCEIRPVTGQVGGGSAPTVELDSWAVELLTPSVSAAQWDRLLRSAPIPVIGRIHHDRFLLDVRTIADEETDTVVSVCARCLQGLGDSVK